MTSASVAAGDPLERADRPQRTDGYLPIAAYGAIGDGHSIGLVGTDGSLDWLCVPNIDAPSVFAALLDAESGGSFWLRPTIPYRASRRYLERTNILETVFETGEGRVRVIDAVTIDQSQRAAWRELVRKVEGVAGQVPLAWSFEPRFVYGRHAASFSRAENALVTWHGQLGLALQTWNAGEPEIDGGRVRATFSLREGEQALLAMQAADDQPLPVPKRASVERRLAETANVWRSWVSRHCYEGPWTEPVERSLLAIRLLSDARRGAITAAGTSSLPEILGGQRNYDYRFGWTRDLSFTLDALLAVGLEQLTHEAVSWLLVAAGSTHPRVDPVYALDAQVVRSQEKLPLRGYRGTRPVHLGNQAGSQLQLGGFGDLVETLGIYTEHGHRLDATTGERVADYADLLCHLWQSRDSGLWELGDSAHYTTSKLGCWVAFDRTLSLAERGQVPRRHVVRWEKERAAVREFIETRLWSEDKRSYLFKAGSDALDCGTLLLARRGFLDPRGDRMLGTIDAIRAELGAGGPLLYRYTGMQEEENAFLACSFWMVEALAAAHRVDEAAELMDQAVCLANDLGLMSEEIEPGNRALWGNFPQALSHLALINAAVALARAQHSG